MHAEELGDNPEQAKTQETDRDASEKNIQVLGLQLCNYTKHVADEDAGGSWNDYVRNERTLKEMFRQFIVKPLLEASGRRALEGLREEGRGMELYREASVGAHEVEDGQEGEAACMPRGADKKGNQGEAAASGGKMSPRGE